MPKRRRSGRVVDLEELDLEEESNELEEDSDEDNTDQEQDEDEYAIQDHELEDDTDDDMPKKVQPSADWPVEFQQPPTNRIRIDFSATFEVLVGGNTPIPKLFTLNRELFCQRSGFFEAATSSTWLKDPTKPVELPDCSVDDFRAYLQCAYSNEVAVLDGVFSEKTAEAYANALVVLWILTDYLQDCTAANTIFEEFIDIHYARSLVPSALTMTMIYELTSAGCPLRRLMVDYCVHEKDLASEPHLVKGLPRELLEDIAIANSTVKQLRIRRIVSTQGDVPIVPSSRARGGHRCRYHRHAEKNAGCK